MNKLIISDNYASTILDLCNTLKSNNINIFTTEATATELLASHFTYQDHLNILEKEEFSIDDAREVSTTCYLTSKDTLEIIIAINSFNLYAQNALLKLLEDTPDNTRITLITTSKIALLPTILSRLIIERRSQNLVLPKSNINIENLDLAGVLEFLKTFNKPTSKEEAKTTIQSLLLAVSASNLKIKEDLLGDFDFAIKAIQNYENIQYLLTPIFLKILRAKQEELKAKI